MKKLSERGILFIRSFEGLKLTAYRDVKGILTIGWGHTGPDVKAGMKVNEYQAETIFQKDLYDKSERFVRPLEQKIGYELTQNQYDALCSLVFNTGPDAIAPANSIFRALKAHDIMKASQSILIWNKVTVIDPETGKKVKKFCQGLYNRRLKEKELFDRTC